MENLFRLENNRHGGMESGVWWVEGGKRVWMTANGWGVESFGL